MCTPASHTSGHIAAILTMLAGGTVLLMDSFDAGVRPSRSCTGSTSPAWASSRRCSARSWTTRTARPTGFPDLVRIHYGGAPTTPARIRQALEHVRPGSASGVRPHRDPGDRLPGARRPRPGRSPAAWVPAGSRCPSWPTARRSPCATSRAAEVRAGRDRRGLRPGPAGHGRVPAATRNSPRRRSPTAGCTPATSASSTPTATCTWWTGSRTSSSPGRPLTTSSRSCWRTC